MLFNRYVLALLITSVVSISSLYLVLTRLDPFADETIALPLFFISLFFSLSAVLSLLGYGLRILFYRDELFLNHFNVSLRQGLILGVCISALMGFQLMRTLSWWNGLLVLLISFLLEIYFVAKE